MPAILPEYVHCPRSHSSDLSFVCAEDMEEMDQLEVLQNAGFIRGLEPLLAGRGGPGEQLLSLQLALGLHQPYLWQSRPKSYAPRCAFVGAQIWMNAIKAWCYARKPDQ